MYKKNPGTKQQENLGHYKKRKFTNKNEGRIQKYIKGTENREDNFPNLKNEVPLQVEEVHRLTYRLIQKRNSP